MMSSLSTQDINEAAVATARELPYEILLQVFTYLPFEALGRCVQVCRMWSTVASDGLLWTSVDLARMYPSNVKDSTSGSSLYRQTRMHAKSISIKNPYHLSGADISPFLRSTIGTGSISADCIYSSVEKFHLENYQRVDCYALASCLSNVFFGSHLSTISFHGTRINESVIHGLCSNSAIRANLRNLDLSFCGITPSEVYQIAYNLNDLESLSLSGNLAVNGESVRFLLERHGHSLTSLELRFIWSLKADWLVTYFKNSKRGVQFLDIRGCEHFTKRDIRELLQICPDAKVLSSVVLEDDSIEGYRQFVCMMASARIVHDTGNELSDFLSLRTKAREVV